MTAEHQAATTNADDAGTNRTALDGPNHTPAVLIGGTGSTVFAGLLFAHLPKWTGCATWAPPEMMSMFCMAVAGVCFMMAAVMWTGANFRHHLALIEAREANIEAREEALRADVRADFAAMEQRMMQAIDDLTEKVAEAKGQWWYSGYGSGYGDRDKQGDSKPAHVVPMPTRRIPPRPLGKQA